VLPCRCTTPRRLVPSPRPIIDPPDRVPRPPEPTCTAERSSDNDPRELPRQPPHARPPMSGPRAGRGGAPRSPELSVAPDVFELPGAARRHLSAGQAVCIWNPYATATWRIARRSGDPLYLKAGYASAYPSLSGERDRLRWLRERGAPVPEVVDYGSADGVEWLVTLAIAGEPATSERHLADPRATVRAIAEGLRAFHAIDPAGCPFDHSVEATLAHIRRRMAREDIDTAGFHHEHQDLTVEAAYQELMQTRPASEDLVVTHGDYCFPNVFLQAGRVVGFLDVGETGLGDRWRDLAVATWSVGWNVGPGFEDDFLEAYGAGLDAARRDFYRLLYDLES